MTQRRWDIVLRVVNGPFASRDAIAYKGPNVVIGAEAGPDGVRVSGRGIAPQHCSISAYGPAEVYVSPMGHNPVRVAPYLDVSWESIEPVRGRVRLERGYAVHVGPTGQRGVTLQYVEVVDLGVAEVERLSSESGEAGDLIVSDAPRPPDAYQARAQLLQVRTLVTDVIDPTLLRVTLALLLGGSSLLLVVALVVFLHNSTRAPPEGQPEFWNVPKYDFSADLTLLEGFPEAFNENVIAWNRQYAGSKVIPELDPNDPSRWDPLFFKTIEHGVMTWSKGKALFKRMDEVKDSYITVLQALEEHQPPLPEVFAGIPMVESCYKSEVTSPVCARGWWQFMPEYGARLRHQTEYAGYDVRDCPYVDTPDGTPYTPKDEEKAPPRNVKVRGRYVSERGCNIGRCAVDFRTDLTKSTRVAMYTLSETLRDPVLTGSGAAVQITIAAHNAGYDDKKIMPDLDKPNNLLPAFLGWQKARGAQVPPAWFYGDNMLCGEGEQAGCQRYMPKETQEYAIKVIGYHLLAVCYYAQNYKEEPVFAGWRHYLDEGGYCTRLRIPTPRQLEGARSDLVCPR